MTVRREHPPIQIVGVVVSLVLIAGCAPAPLSSDYGAPPGSGRTAGSVTVEDYVLVDCMLPGRVQRLGTMMTYLTPRRPAKTTPRDCAIRGGEYVVFDRSDYSSALSALLPEANRGNKVAQTHVGEIYEKGLGLPNPDYAKAAVWYRKAADQEHSAAQTRLGALYERGLGVPKNKAQALNWYRKASGIDQDELAFKSSLQAERAAFRQEMAKRRQLVASLQQRLRSTPTPSKAARAAIKTQKLDTKSRVEQLKKERSAAERVSEDLRRELKQERSTGREDQEKVAKLEDRINQLDGIERSRKEASDELLRFEQQLVAAAR